MMQNVPAGIYSLIEWVCSSEVAFYRELWKGAREFSKLPSVGRSDFERTPLSKRRYKKVQSFVKIIRGGLVPFLSEWDFSDIAREEYGSVGARPMVHLTDPHDALEKSLWCYERGRVPAIGESDPGLTAFVAEAYRIDSLITDASALARLHSHLEQRRIRISSISILGDHFDMAMLSMFVRYAEEVRLVLAFPETGAFASAPFSDHPIFSPLSGCTIERGSPFLLSKEARLVTPVIRYRLEIPPSTAFAHLV